MRVDGVGALIDLITRRSQNATTATPSLAGKPYCPSSGSEGMAFEEAVCDAGCMHYRDIGNDVTDCALGILMQAWATADVADPEFPKQWVYDAKGRPTCTAFKRDPDIRLCGNADSPADEYAAYQRAMQGDA